MEKELGADARSILTDGDTICDITGRCEIYELDALATAYSGMCQHCGAEMHWHPDHGWVRWDHPSQFEEE